MAAAVPGKLTPKPLAPFVCFRQVQGHCLLSRCGAEESGGWAGGSSLGHLRVVINILRCAGPAWGTRVLLRFLGQGGAFQTRRGAEKPAVLLSRSYS